MGLEDVRLVEIEVHSHCNRKCSWCPNSFIDRTEAKELDWGAYAKVIKELKEMEYSGTISYSRYNEPMARMGILSNMVEFAKRELPNARLVTNTNGDFLTAKNLMGLMIDELTIMDYDNLGIRGCTKKLSEAGIKMDAISEKFIEGHFGKMKILCCLNWAENSSINDRGGSLGDYSQERRTAPCMEPTRFIGIDYNGNVMPCCNTRSDFKEHKPFILGNIAENTLEEIYNTNKAKAIRKLTSTGEPDLKSIIEIGVAKYPCKHCTKEDGRYTRDNPGISY